MSSLNVHFTALSIVIRDVEWGRLINSKNAGDESVPTKLNDAIYNATCYVITFSFENTPTMN